MKTIKYYTDSGFYKGWNKAKWIHFQSVLNWLLSGNYVRINGIEYRAENTASVRHALVAAIHDNGNV